MDSHLPAESVLPEAKYSLLLVWMGAVNASNSSRSQQPNASVRANLLPENHNCMNLDLIGSKVS